VVEEVVARLHELGVSAAVIKHSSRSMTLPEGKDTSRFWRAGAKSVVFLGPGETSIMFRNYEEETDLQSILKRVGSGVDVVLTEGFKGGTGKKIEILREGCSERVTSPGDRIAEFVGSDPAAAEKAVEIILQLLHKKN